MNDQAHPPDPTTVRRRARKAGIPPEKRGRKPDPDRRVTLTIRLRPAVRAAAEVAAEAAGLTVSAFIERELATALGTAAE